MTEDEPPEASSVRLTDLVSGRSDIPDLRQRFELMARAARETGEDLTVEDLLAQSRRNLCRPI
ncbi:hypothetical protein [Natronosalvus amylolyticus]|uniref:hypothetical protein n=1 Tax=Natronosalvus amylolyticus TaxID=2961994 RepID=UPI0020C945EB|nr:hypothetical protein [Natronosalvus amylolyticus]